MCQREIITIQAGHLANHVGARMWEEQRAHMIGYHNDNVKKCVVDYSTNWHRASSQRAPASAMPRMVAIDLQGSVGSPAIVHAEHSQQYDQHASQWTQAAIVTADRYAAAQSPLSHWLGRKVTNKNDTQSNADMNTADFSLHPKSVLLCQSYRHGDEASPFDVYPMGTQLARSTEVTDGFDDTLHVFAEECDSLQGFCLLVDVDDAFGGLANQTVETLKDDYGNKSIMTFGLGADGQETTLHSANRVVLNNVLSTTSLAQNSSLYVPLSLRQHWRPSVSPSCSTPRTCQGLDWQAGVLGAIADTVTLPLRCPSSNQSMSSLCAMLSLGTSSMNVAGAAFTTQVQSEDLMAFSQSSRDLLTWPELKPFMPDFKPMHSPVSELSLLRYNPANENLGINLTEHLSAKMDNSVAFTAPLPWLQRITDSRVTAGSLSGSPGTFAGLEPTTLLADVSASKDVGSSLLALAAAAKSINIRLQNRYQRAEMEADDWIMCMEELQGLVDAYEECS